MKSKNPFKNLTKFELCLWLISIALVLISFLIPEKKDYLSLVSSLIGVTALIFLAKGFVIGQVLIVVFSVLYGIISFYFRYYGEMITYVFMTMPMAILAMISWIKNPYKDTGVVKISTLTKKSFSLVMLIALVITAIFYFILDYFNTANIIFSTLSITTSFVAVALTYLRSPYYALGYALNDIVLIVLWILATIQEISYFPMVVCFAIFLLNDLYGFYNWLKMQRQQEKNL